MNLKMIKSEIKLIIKEPMSILLYIAPILLVLVLGTFSRLFMNQVIIIGTFQIDNYLVYILSFSLVMMAGLIGIVIGLSFIDDQDAKILTLVKVTPYGLRHYLLSRLLIPSIYLTVLAILAVFFIPKAVSMIKILTVMPFILSEMLILGAMIFIFSPDKVMALTYAKGLNVFLLFCLVPLINHPLLKTVSFVIPFTWITRMLLDFSVFNGLGLVLTHGIYLAYFLKGLMKEV